MSDLRIEVCSETGICSIIRDGSNKVDLMPFEVDEIRNAGADADTVRKVVGECDYDFATALDDEAIEAIKNKLS
jgi:hypothetical protein